MVLIFKDVNGVLDKFIGTWTGSINNKDYTLVIEKGISVFQEVTTDVLYLRYEIKKSNTNVTMQSTLTLPNSDAYVAEGRYLTPSGAYQLYYTGFKYKCGQKGTLIIKTINNDTQMKLYLLPGEVYLKEQDCPNGIADQVFPVADELILTKQ